VPSDHRLATRSQVRLGDCREETWVQGRDWGPSVRLLQDACRAAGFDPVISAHCDDHVLLQALVAAGAGVALLPRLAATHLLPGVTVVPLRRPELARHVLAITPEGYTSPATSLLLGAISASSRCDGGHSR
jgi:DNA-binding transcriptional LysR family regulator